MNWHSLLKKRNIIIFIGIILLYLILGTSLPFIRHQEISKEYQEKFQQMNFREDTEGTERLAYINDNVSALSYRLQMVEAAEQEIIMSTFAFSDGEGGKRLIASLVHAADRGVSIKVLVDGVSGLVDMGESRWMRTLASHEGITVKLYNPINPLKPWQFQTRMHDKYFIVDDQMYLMGGRNTNDLFLGDYISPQKQNVDAEVFVWSKETGGNHSLQQIKDYFAVIWEAPENRIYRGGALNSKRIKKTYQQLDELYRDLEKEYPEITQEHKWTEKTYPVNKITLLTNPIGASKKEPTLWYALNQIMAEGEQVVIHTPYVVMGKKMYRDMTALVHQDVDIEMIINDPIGGANPFGCTDYLNQQEQVLKTGIRVYEHSGVGSSHTKMILVDDQISIVGSFNMDMRSAYLDTELMLVIDSKELHEEIAAETVEQKEESKSIAMGEEYQYGEQYQAKEFSVGKRIIYALMRVIVRPIRHLL